MNKYELEKTSAIANKVIALMQNDKQDWFKPFTGDSKYGVGIFPKNIKGTTYSGMNLFILLLENYRYKQNTWITLRETNKLGGRILKDQKGTAIKFFRFDEEKDAPITKWYHVFNIDQTNLEEVKPELFKSVEPMPLDLIERNKAVDLFVKNTQANIVHNKSGRCFYIPSEDMINMSPLDTWKASGNIPKETFYYSTLLHELTHWTGHKNRLDRDINNGFGSNAYAYEELIAEIGSILFSHEFNFTKTIRDNHAKYLNSWIKCLNNDYTFLTGATAQAQKAVDYFMSSK